MEPINTNIQSTSSSIALPWFFVALIIVASLSIGGTYYYLSSSQKSSSSLLPTYQQPVGESNTNTSPQESSASQQTAPSEEWKTTAIMGKGLSLQYPYGWHVASYVPNGKPLGYHEVFIHTDPIVTETGEGPLTTITITSENGLEKPFETFDKTRETFKSTHDNVKEEILTSSDFGQIYHYTGTEAGNGMQGGQPAEVYFFKDGTLSSPLNVTLVSVSLSIGSITKENSSLLKDIVTRIKKG